MYKRQVILPPDVFAEIESLPVAQVMCVSVHNAVDERQDGDAMNIMTAVTDNHVCEDDDGDVTVEVENETDLSDDSSLMVNVDDLLISNDGTGNHELIKAQHDDPSLASC